MRYGLARADGAIGAAGEPSLAVLAQRAAPGA
jgi:hypothetical protein